MEDLEKIHKNRVILIRDTLPKNMVLMEQDPTNSVIDIYSPPKTWMIIPAKFDISNFY